MAYDAKTERLIALKKLAGKAQTSNDKGLANEALPSGITSTSETIFGETISTSPSNSSLYTITGKVEYLRFPVSFIAGSDTSDGRHGFELKLPSDYEANSSNTKAGTYPFQNSQSINITSGSLQLIPPSFATDYEAKPFYGGTSAKDSGTQIPLLDARDWYLDYFNGIFFQQDPSGTGDQSDNPDYVEAYLYIGDMLDTVVTNAGGTGGGDPGAQYLVLQATGSLTAERVFNPSTGISVSDGGAGGNYTLTVDNSVVATLTGSQFSGNVGITGSLGVTSTISSPAISGSLTHLSDGSSYIIAGNNIQVSTGSNGSITITGTSTGDITAVTAGTGLSGGGNSGAVTLNLDINGLTGSLDSPASGDMLAAADVDESGAVKKISINNLTAFQTGWSNSSGYGIASFNGRLYLKPSDLGTAAAVDPATDTLMIEDADDSSTLAKKTGISDFISAVKGTGLAAASGILGVDNSVVATLTGSQFSSNVGITGSLGVTSTITSPAISGSLTHLSDGSSYLIAGSNITIVTGSSGAVTITAAGGIDGSGATNRIATWADTDTLTSDADLTWDGTTLYATSAGTTLNIQGDSNLNGTVVINQSGVDKDFRVETKNKSSALQVDGGTDQVLLFSGSLSDASGHGSSASDPNPRTFTDTNFFVSGSIGSRNTSTRGTSVFGGDTLVSGALVARNGISGSLTHLTDGTSYLIAGSGITITSASNGAITITNDGTVGDITSVTAGTGLTGGGSSGDVTLNIDNSVVATLTGSQFSGNVGITGSLQVGVSGTGENITFYGQDADAIGMRWVPGVYEHGALVLGAADHGVDLQIYGETSGRYLWWNQDEDTLAVSGKVSQLNGDVVFNESAGAHNFRVESINKTHAISLDGSLDKVSILSGSGVTGAGIDVNFFVSGTIGSQGSSVRGSTLFGGDTAVSGAIKALGGISGSLTHLTDGTSYLIAGNNVTITTGSSGAVTIAVPGGSTPPGGNNTEVQFNDAGSFAGDSNFTFNKTSNTLTVNNISGSLTKLPDGTSYLIAGNNITIATGSSGAVTVSSTGGFTRSKFTYELTASHAASSNLNIPDIDFSSVSYDSQKIDIFVNGQLMTSGSSKDYIIPGAVTGSVNFNFGLLDDDIVAALLY